MFQRNNTPWHFTVKQGKKKKSCSQDHGRKIINFLNMFSGWSRCNSFLEIIVGNSARELLFSVIGSGQKPCWKERAKPACSYSAWRERGRVYTRVPVHGGIAGTSLKT